ncbi:MAG: hypothetical protein M3N97_16340 [Pseudomonadota bacterium]|nr:hypothetical protein [Pseudomonadota bacterium]
MIKKLMIAVAGTVLISMAHAQAVDAVKETGRSLSEGTKEAGENAEAAVHSQPEKSLDKGRAKTHKAKARYHRHKAKAAADAAVH